MLFTTQHLQQMLGYGGAMTGAAKQLTNRFDADLFPPLTCRVTMLLDLLRNNMRLPPIETTVSQEEFTKAL
jgi:hypothetical protein